MSGFSEDSVVIALTGGIACGKSSAGEMLEVEGFERCDTDLLAHQLMRKGTIVFAELVGHFGRDILADDGEIFRPALGNVVFKDAQERATLNRIVHPAVRDYLCKWILLQRERGRKAVAEIPLLFESQMDQLDWDAIVCLASSEELIAQRLSERGLNEVEIIDRVQSQISLNRKREKSDYVVWNNGSLKELKASLMHTIGQIEGLGER